MLSKLRLKGQVGNRHFNHVKFSEEKGRYRSGVLGGGTVQRHRKRREHSTTVSNSSCWDIRRASSCHQRPGDEGSWRPVNKFRLYSENNVKLKEEEILNRMSERISLPFTTITQEASRLEAGRPVRKCLQ